MRNCPVNTKIRKEGGGGGSAPGTGADIPLQTKERTTPEQISTLQPLKGPLWSRLPKGTAVHAEDPYWSRLIPKDCSLWEGPTLKQGESVRKKYQRGSVTN